MTDHATGSSAAEMNDFRTGYEFGYGDGQVGEYQPEKYGAAGAHATPDRAAMLRINTDPIREVPAAQRDVWLPKPENRCYHEDGRGRCRRYDTRATRVEGSRLGVEFYCPVHAPSEANDGV